MTEAIAKTRLQTLPLEVLHISGNGLVCGQAQQFLDSENLTCQSISICEFGHIDIDTDKIGVAVVDSNSVMGQYYESLYRVIANLQDLGIATILYGQNTEIQTADFEMVTVVTDFSSQQLSGLVKTAVNLRSRFISKVQPAVEDEHSKHLEYQLKMAGSVQRDFLPKSLPDNENLKWSITFMPADWVSGDIYDITRLDEEHIGFYLADAVGHSMPAALLTMFLKQALQMRQTTGNEYRIFSPLEVINNLNQKMVGQNLSGCQFATCCYFLLNTKTLQLDYCRAGHPYPIRFGRDNKPELLETKGALLGVFDNAQFEQGSVQLQSGDRLVLYSDGAEPFIDMDTEGGRITFNEQFLALTGCSGAAMTAGLEDIVKSSAVPAGEVDDTTMVVLDVA